MSIDVDPIKLCCQHRQSEHNGALCPTGTFMCATCFSTFFPHQAYTDDEGDKVGICLNCRAHELWMIELMTWIKAIEDNVDPDPDPTQG